MVANDLIYLTSAHGPDAPLYAVPVSAEGELTLDEEHVAWVQDRGNYMQTPVGATDTSLLKSSPDPLHLRSFLTSNAPLSMS